MKVQTFAFSALFVNNLCVEDIRSGSEDQIICLFIVNRSGIYQWAIRCCKEIIITVKSQVF